MFVHSFGTKDAGHGDYQAFVGALGVLEEALPGRIVTVPESRNGTRLHLGWVHGGEQYLRA